MDYLKSGTRGDIFQVKFCYGYDGWIDGLLGWERYIAELWNQKILGKIGIRVYSKRWIGIFSGGIKTRRP
jgi:hypothetical protein